MKTYRTDVLIIGAGQAGLVTGYFLQRKKIQFLLVDANERAGDSWRARYDSLGLLTPWSNNTLPGLMPDVDMNSYPTKDQLADYLEQYAKHFSFPIHHKTTIKKLKRKGNIFVADTGAKQYFARRVVIATGAFQKPFIPTNLGTIPKNVFQLHSSSYKNTKQIICKRILIVGGGHSGVQIGAELSGSSSITLATNKRLFFSNKYDFLYAIISRLVPIRIVRMLVEMLGVRKIHIPEVEELFKSNKLIIKKELVKIENNKFFFADNSNDTFDCIIWATGFRFDYSWIAAKDVFDKEGRLRHNSGVSVVKGLYFVYPEKDYAFIRDLPKKVEHLVKNLN